MDFSKLTSNEKLAVYGSAAVVLAGLISNWGGLLFLSILLGIGMLAVVFLPQLSPTTKLPGSKGSLMAALGIAAAALAVIAALQWIGYLSLFGSFSGIMFLVAIVGSLVMAWAGWQELQSEGGKWQFGASTASAAPAAAAADPAPPVAPVAADPAVEPVAPVATAAPPAAPADPVDGDRGEPRPSA